MPRVTKWPGKQTHSWDPVAVPGAFQTIFLSVGWQMLRARLTHYSLLTWTVSVAWPQAKQNEHSCGGLGRRPTPDSAVPQTERLWSWPPLRSPHAGESPLEEQRSAHTESCCPSGQETFRKGLANWPHDWAEWLSLFLGLQKGSDIMQEPFC